MSELKSARDEVDAKACEKILVDALKACLKKGSRWHPCDPVVVQARAALKAVGEEA